MTSIQKVLNQRKKTPQEILREQFEKQQTSHISKAITSQECAPKEKHVRAIILGTFKEHSASYFFSCATRLALQEHPVTCWKFLYTVNKLIRNGHDQCIQDCMRYSSRINDLGRLWGHLKQGYGQPIATFAKLIRQKLRFHRKYPQIPGNLSMEAEELSEMVGNSVNNLFELSVDLMDYMDEVLALQECVFNSLDKSRSNSMTLQGQCKLTPLIQCVQDAASLYDALVKLLFRLHAELPADTLSGHRERFLGQYRSLQTAFQTSQTLQYFKSLIQVPSLPDNPPNFLVEAELATHRAPVVTVADDDEEQASPDFEVPPTAMTTAPAPAALLVDFSEAPALPFSGPVGRPVAASGPTEKKPKDDMFDAVFGSDMGDFTFNGVHHRHGSTGDLLAEIQRLKAEIERLKAEHKEKVDALYTRIKTLEQEVKGLVQLKEKYEDKMEDLKEDESKNNQITQMAEEKFRKMRDVYTKLRDEHVNLLRKNAEIVKELQQEKQKAEEIEQNLRTKSGALAHLEHERLAQSEVNRSADDVTDQLTEARTNLMDVERAKKELETQLEEVTHAKREITEQASKLESRLSEMEHEKLSQIGTISSLESRLGQLSTDLDSATNRLAKAEGQLSDYMARCLNLESTRDTLDRLRERLLVTACERGADQIREAVSFFDAPELITCKGSAEFLLSRIETVLNEVDIVEGICTEFADDPEVIDKLVCAVGQFSSRLSECLLQGKATSHSAPSLDQADELVASCKLTAEEGINFLGHLKSGSWEADAVLGYASSLLAHLKSVQSLAELLRPQVRDVAPEELGDLVDEEMRATTDAIEFAENKFKELLEKSREDMSGVQLEVNERILDSCTQLMLAIKILVQRSKVMQREIVAEGRGTASIGEFYKKHHRWTEGLISAAKTVGLGATTLVEAADKLVSGEAKLEELIVCSQEIAASTTQLLVASRVKANPKSFSLKQLQTASSDVAKATGSVVANAKSAAELKDQQDLMNFSQMSLTQAKRMEIESQVRVLQLESELERERVHLGDLRKQHYKLAAEAEDMDPENRQPSEH